MRVQHRGYQSQQTNQEALAAGRRSKHKDKTTAIIENDRTSDQNTGASGKSIPNWICSDHHPQLKQ